MPKSHFPTRIDPINLPLRLRDGLTEAESLLDQQKPQKALELLSELDRKYPRRSDVLGLSADACAEIGDTHKYLHYMLALHEILPNNAETNLGLAGGYLNNGRLALALGIFERFLKRWPGHPAAGEVQKTIKILWAQLEEIFAKLGMGTEDGLDFSRKHEELQVCMENGRYSRCKMLADELLKRKPDFVPPLNNLSQVYWLEGNLPKAIETCQRVLEIQPENVHALANIIRFLYLAGHKEDTPAYIERLKLSRAEASDRWIKIAEALSFIGDDHTLVALYKQMDPQKDERELNAAFYHWLAVSEYRLGRGREARTHWKKALEINAACSIAQENLDDLKLPAYEQNGPWAYPLGDILPKKIVREMVAFVERAARKKDDDSFKLSVQRFLNSHPELIQLAPLLLERGEPFAKEFILDTADMSAHPALLTLLKEFAFGKSGSDSSRMKAAQVLSKHNVVGADKANLWLKGEWHSTLLLGFEIFSGPIGKPTLRPKALNLMEQSIEALKRNDGRSAEDLLRKALAIHPDDPSFLNNLAVALQAQGKKAEAEALAEQIYERFPDYFFGQVARARKNIHEKDLEKARAILDKLLLRKKLHITEFTALCAAQVDFFIEDDKLEGALSWLEMWEKVEPEGPKLQGYDETVETLRVLAKLKEITDTKPRRVKKPKKKG